MLCGGRVLLPAGPDLQLTATQSNSLVMEQHIFMLGCPRWEISCWAVTPHEKEVHFRGIVGLNWQFQT